MSLKGLFDLIDVSWIGKLVSRKQEIIEKTNPDRIYVENVRSFFNLSFRFAQVLCELAVRKGLFRKRVGVTCPNCERIMVSSDSDKILNGDINCEVCEMNEEDRHIFNVRDLKKINYYQLIRHGH